MKENSGKEQNNKEKRSIEWLVHWAFTTQQVETAAKALIPCGPTMAPSAILGMMALGVRVDNSSAAERFLGMRCHEDAVVIYDLVMRLPNEAKGLVAMYGRNGSRPDYCAEGVGEETQERDGKSKLRWIYADERNRTGEKWPKMIWEGLKPEHVQFHRDIWAVWYEALNLMIEPANKELTAFSATHPLVSAQPWDWDGEYVPALAC